MDQITGCVERFVYKNSDNGFGVVLIKESHKKDFTTIVGAFPNLSEGEIISCFGRWVHNKKFGIQFEVSRYSSKIPADVKGIEKYLSSGLIKGIGVHFAKKIVGKFGVKTLEVIDKNPERLLDIEGIGKKRAATVSQNWQEQKDIREVMMFLQQYNVSPSYAQKIYKVYGNGSIMKIKDNPYALAQDIYGIGFKIADEIAHEMGIEKNSSKRIVAGIEYVLLKLSAEGHSCYPMNKFLKIAEELLNVDVADIKHHVENAPEESRIILSAVKSADGELEQLVAMKFFHFSEIGIANEVFRIQSGVGKFVGIDLEKHVQNAEQSLEISLATNQKLAVKLSLEKKMQIITGGPGTGKSTITKVITTIAKKLGMKVILAAPTGRAAKKLHEVTGLYASTIHGLLEFSFQNNAFLKNRNNPLSCDIVIIDEVSMIDTLLMYSMLKAIPSEANLVLIGDIFQLPSVGSGNVLKDFIHSGYISTITLQEIYRQAKGSQIITNAHMINRGVFPQVKDCENDFLFINKEDPNQIIDIILQLLTMYIPRKFANATFEEVQVLSPMRRGILGIDNLNIVIQSAINPRQDLQLLHCGRKFLVGDKVMQTRNDYNKNVFNGDMGIVSRIDEDIVYVKFDDREVEYEFRDLDNISLAYASSVHKFQGSECKCVVIIMHTSHFMMLQRNLLYTAITRGKDFVVIIGSAKALAMAVNNDAVKHRFTSLPQALENTFASSSKLM